MSTTTDFAAQIAAMESRLSSRIAAIQSNAPGQRNNGGGSPAGDPRPLGATHLCTMLSGGGRRRRPY
ncbi:hypothetical protein E4U60_001179 [Claviceps pazoutovae]|uniref:Uncharacterized protein n=1 Tax=Claviceps pazoutovae TaxID=1649127 RepID=A0A9P7SHY5_9HYPO|nr:hypothetical protein E4U60_001179 [Claviceps pazoutovae]